LDSYLKKQDEIKQQLVEFIESENDLNVNWKDGVLKMLGSHDVKFIKCL
jgi:hypothetical protein